MLDGYYKFLNTYVNKLHNTVNNKEVEAKNINIAKSKEVVNGSFGTQGKYKSINIRSKSKTKETAIHHVCEMKNEI